MCKPTLLSRKPPLATPLRQAKQTTKNGRTTLQNTSGQALCPEIPNRHTRSGCKLPVSPNWGALVQAILHRTLPSVPKSFRGPWDPPSRTCPEEIPAVATDYFSKWVEAEAYASIKDKDVTNSYGKTSSAVWNSQTIIADNGPQFDSIAFRNFCSELNIRNSYSTPRYPQSNGQAEATNKTLITALKKRLEQAKGKWVEELPGVLWAYRTTPGRQQETLPSPSHTKLGWADEVRKAQPSGWQTITKGIRSLQSQTAIAEEEHSSLASGSPLQAPPSLQQTHPLALLFALLTQLQIFLLFLLNDTSVRSCLTSPSEEPLILASCKRASIDPPGSLPQLNLPGEPRCPPSGG
ncbi:hypothetical protein CK203_006400 [Vitis vinifera]|uniref:Integrase catalytic domain-containing protein n=1 Tax=Vitis vinifera TaxID=29760 RepID=A0A438KBM6_VITVI|nr:hypothetical protein CK203_006400 [Vitis vinifera]